MKKIKKVLKLLILVFLIFLAGIGIGMTGGVPIPLTKPKRDAEKDQTELVENQDEESASKQSQIKE